MHPVTRIYWTAWLWQIQTTQAQGKLLMHGANAWYWCMVGRVPEFVLYTHTCLARHKQLVSGKNLHGQVSWIRVHYWLHPWTHFIKLYFGFKVWRSTFQVPHNCRVLTVLSSWCKHNIYSHLTRSGGEKLNILNPNPFWHLHLLHRNLQRK